MSNRQSGKAALERGFAPLLFTPSLVERRCRSTVRLCEETFLRKARKWPYRDFAPHEGPEEARQFSMDSQRACGPSDTFHSFPYTRTQFPLRLLFFTNYWNSVDKSKLL